EKHDDAARLLSAYPAPQPGDPPEKVSFYHSMLLLRARELRLAGQLDRAAAAIAEILASDWGKNSLDAKKEEIALMEDGQKFAQAARAWVELMNALRPQIERSARLRDQYFECYYRLTLCRYRMAQQLTDETKKREG